MREVFYQHYLEFLSDDATSNIPRIVLSLHCAGDMKIGERSKERSAFFSSVTRRGARGDDAKIVGLTQVHSKKVHFAGVAGVNGIEGDGLVSFKKGIACSVTVADCMPLFLFIPGTPFIAALHSGSAGTGILREGVALLRKKTHDAVSDIHLVMGPSIRKCCYRVDEERAARFIALHGEDTAVKREKNWYLDMVVANLNIASDLGIHEIHVSPFCTQCDERFGSYRREGNENYTRMLGIVGYF